VTWLIRQFFPTTPFGWVRMLMEALAWPVAGVVIAAMFRAEVRLVLERVVRLKYRNFEAQFHRDLAQAEDLADPTAPKRLLDLPSESRRVFHELDGPPPSPTRAGPRELIDDAWKDLSDAADRAAGTVGIDPAPALAGRGVLAGLDLLRFDRLRRLHAQVAHAADWEPSPDDAARFAGLSRPLADRLVQATPTWAGLA